MFDWLQTSLSDKQAIPWDQQLPRLVAALGFGIAITWIYRVCRRESAASPFPATLVLLSILIAMVTQVIGDNVARAFSLVGALSIVRFRTSVRDTKDTAFVIFAVVVGMALGAGQALVACCGFGVLTIATLLYRDPVSGFAPGIIRLTIRLSPSETVERDVLNLLREQATQIRQLAVSTIRQGTGLEFVYSLHLRETVTPSQLVASVNRLEGIQSVEVHSSPQES